MKNKILLSFAFLASGLVGASAETAAASQWTGEITPKLIAFDLNDDTSPTSTSYLERYGARRSLGGDRRSGLYLDLDLDLIYQRSDDEKIELKRWGDGQYRQGGHAQWDNERFRLSADYSFFRRSTGGIELLYNPDKVAGGTDPSYFTATNKNTSSGYVAQFNDDAAPFLAQINRLAYGLGLALKPGLLGAKTTLAVNYTGYLRYGRTYQTYVLGGSDMQSTIAGDRSYVLQRWRGYNRNVDQNMNRLSWTLTAAPKDLFNFAYAGTWEKFDNRARDYSHADIAPPAPYFYNPASDRSRPLGFIPDSTLISHAVRANRTFGGTYVAASYKRSQLEQDSFTAPQKKYGYTQGEIGTENASLDVNTTVTPVVSLQGFVKYGLRENDSTFPVVGLHDAVTSEKLGAHLSRLESMRYGAALSLRPASLASTIAFGWQAEDKERDIVFHNTGVVQSVSLYRPNSESSEFYAKLSSLDLRGFTFHVTSSYATADQTGLVIEPSQAFGLKFLANYAVSDGVTVSGYYNLRDTENDNNAFTDKGVTSPRSYAQNVTNTLQSAGVSFNYRPTKSAGFQAGLDWMQSDAGVLYYESTRRRYESTTTFALRDTLGSTVDSYVFTLGGDVQASDNVKLTGQYSLVTTDGNLASGSVAEQLSAIDDSLDNQLHTLVLGADYKLSENRVLRLSYSYERYSDNAFPLLTGSAQSIMVGLTIRL